MLVPLLVALLGLLPAALPQQTVLLNEVLVNPDADGEGEWVELFNNGTTAADLSGWVVSDNRGASSGVDVPCTALLCEGSVLAPGGRQVVVLRAGDGLLNNGADSAVLYNAAGTVVDEVSWTTSAPGDRSLARQPDGGLWAPGWQAPTRGAANADDSSGGGSGGLAAAGAPNVTCAAGTAQLAVASFNIQNLGAAKVGRPAVMAALGAIAARYDIVAVQELSQVDTGAGCATQPSAPVGTAACALLAAANAANTAAAGGAAPRYGLSASVRLGGAGQEQYALLYDAGKLVLERAEVYPDPDALFVREPWVSAALLPSPRESRSRPRPGPGEGSLSCSCSCSLSLSLW
eukprot:SAG22_NODE_344_length_11914_cov_6.665679_6_plen_347_part_00